MPVAPSTIDWTDPIASALREVLTGRYAIARELGRGGMGAVFLARDLSLDRDVAIKVLPPEYAVQPTLRERFVREARTAAALSHPHIVHVHTVEEVNGLHFIVMQFVDGETLTDRVARSGPYDAQDCAQLLQDAAWALGYAHARGIVHRDVKPDNLMIERGTGRVMIMDFGIARRGTTAGLTEVGQSIGTPSYMSPEQAAAEELTGASDLYALGCVGFFAATGRPPFHADSAHKILMQHLTAPAPDVTTIRPEFPRGLSDVIAKALQKEPAARFASGEVMAEDIGALQLRSQEVAPLLRMFQQRSAQSLQAMAMLAALFAMFWLFSGRAGSLLGSVVLVLTATIAVTMAVQSLDRVRFVVRQGFTVHDVRAAGVAMMRESARAQEQLLSDPVERRRIERRRRFAIFGGVVAAAQLPLIPKLVWSTVDGRAVFHPVGALVLLIVTIIVGVSVALWATQPVRTTFAQRIACWGWSSAFGFWVFARAERRYAQDIAKFAVRTPRPLP